MNPPRYYGGDDPIEYLRQLAAHLQTSLGLQIVMSLERLAEDQLDQVVQQRLTLRDLHRTIESLEADLKQARGW